MYGLSLREEENMLPENRITTHPGEMLLEEFLVPMELSQTELARAIRIPLNRLNEVIRGKRGVTVDTALRLSGYFKNSPEFWLHLQIAHDLTKARMEMQKRKLPRRHRKAA